MSIAEEGLPFIIVPAFIGLILVFFGARNLYLSIPGAVLLAIGGFSLFFFRDPSREIPQDEKAVVSPGDGTVMEVAGEGSGKIVRIFLSVFNVHIQRSPYRGTVTEVKYCPGKFMPAMKPRAHIENEKNVIKIKTEKGEMTVSQIAGIIARRVVSRVKAGDNLEKGQKIGLIRFGSQVDIMLPAGADIRVKPGDKVIGGETVIAEF